MTAGWQPPVLATARLLLRPVEASDAPAIFAACSDPRLTTHTLFDTHAAVEESLGFVTDYVFDQYADEVPDPFAVALRADPGALVGVAGLRWTADAWAMELGYWVAPPHWGQGIATEAVGRLAGWAFATFPADELVRLQARVLPGNPASDRVLLKCGFRFEGTLRRTAHRRGAHLDARMYSRLRDDPAPG